MAKKNSSDTVARSTEKKQHFYLTAKENAYLPDGKFLAKGAKARATDEYVERLRAANDQTFIITQE